METEETLTAADVQWCIQTAMVRLTGRDDVDFTSSECVGPVFELAASKNVGLRLEIAMSTEEKTIYVCHATMEAPILGQISCQSISDSCFGAAIAGYLTLFARVRGTRVQGGDVVLDELANILKDDTPKALRDHLASTASSIIRLN